MFSTYALNVDELPEGWTIDRIKAMGVATASLVSSTTYAVEDGVTDLIELSPTVIVDCGDQYLVHDETDNLWHMGQMDDDGTIWCWGAYGEDLGDAINGL